MDEQTKKQFERIIEDYFSITWAMYGPPDTSYKRRIEHVDNVEWLKNYVKENEKN